MHGYNASRQTCSIAFVGPSSVNPVEQQKGQSELAVPAGAALLRRVQLEAGYPLFSGNTFHYLLK